MADEPSNGELGRSIGELKAMVANLVGTREYAEFQRHVEHRLGEIDADLRTEREAREKGFNELRAGQEKGRQITKGALLATLGTLVAAIALAALNAWVHAGGH